MSQDTAGLVLSCPPGIQWVQEQTHILIVDEYRGASYRLSGPEAAIWNWMALAYPYSKLVHLLAALLNLPLASAEQYLAAVLQKCRAAGLLEVQD